MLSSLPEKPLSNHHAEEQHRLLQEFLTAKRRQAFAWLKQRRARANRNEAHTQQLIAEYEIADLQQVYDHDRRLFSDRDVFSP